MRLSSILISFIPLDGRRVATLIISLNAGRSSTGAAWVAWVGVNTSVLLMSIPNCDAKAIACAGGILHFTRPSLFCSVSPESVSPLAIRAVSSSSTASRRALTTARPSVSICRSTASSGLPRILISYGSLAYVMTLYPAQLRALTSTECYRRDFYPGW